MSFDKAISLDVVWVQTRVSAPSDLSTIRRAFRVADKIRFWSTPLILIFLLHDLSIHARA